MISLILPYWNRPNAARQALDLIGKHYADMELEVVVVDDGSKPQFSYDFNPDIAPVLKVVRLHEKLDAKCACVPFNAGVRESSGDILALSSIEMLHNRPILAAMRDELRSHDTYVCAAVWSPTQRRWEAHSTLTHHYHFMTMLYRDLWERAGGMDEEYRDGMSWDDADYEMRLKKAGAQFVFRDDLQVEHPHSGETKTRYPKENIEKNRRIFEAKW